MTTILKNTDIRNLWEADPKLSFGTLATKYSVSKQTICSRSKKENWKRRGNLADINRKAIIRADEKTDDREKADGTPRLKGDDEAIDLRTDILCKHRAQIIVLDSMQDSAKVLFDSALKTKKKEDFWMAKIAADICKDHIIATSKKQAMERKCWGMDEPDLSSVDLESFSEKELDDFCFSGKLPMRFRKILSGFSNER